jgi:glycosyltransferase involved in cell wall biosynthesis
MHLLGMERTMYPKVSVIMATYNSEKYVGLAIQSIINQSFSNFELIIVDDGSQDKTVLEILKFKDTRIIFKAFTENKGVVSARNWAIDNSVGEYIAIMDSDDISDPLRFEKQISYIEKQNADICGTFHKDYYELTGKIKYRKGYILEQDLKALLTIYSPLIHPSVIIKKTKLKKSPYSIVFEKAEEYALWCEMALNGAKIVCCPEYLLTYRIHPTQMTIRNKEKNRILTNEIRDEYIYKLLGISEIPKSMSFLKRIRKGLNFLTRLNQKIPNISWRVNYQIYARFQFHGNGILTPIIRLERAVIAIWMTIYGIRNFKKN